MPGLVLVASVAFGAVACSDTSEQPGTTPVTPVPTSASTAVVEPPGAGPSPSASSPGPATPTTGPLSQPFGPACSRLPDTGAGSRAALARQRAGAAVSDVPFLSRAAAAIRTARLTDTLDAQTDATVFVPSNTAFAHISSDDIRQALRSRDRAADLLRYHVVPGRLAPDQLPGYHQTLEGQRLTVTGSGQDLTVDGHAHVVCGNIQTANATVYVVDDVLWPS